MRSFLCWLGLHDKVWTYQRWLINDKPSLFGGTRGYACRACPWIEKDDPYVGPRVGPVFYHHEGAIIIMSERKAP